MQSRPALLAQVVLNKAGSGGVYLAAVTDSTTIVQTGKGVTAVTTTDTVRHTELSLDYTLILRLNAPLCGPNGASVRNLN